MKSLLVLSMMVFSSAVFAGQAELEKLDQQVNAAVKNVGYNLYAFTDLAGDYTPQIIRINKDGRFLILRGIYSGLAGAKATFTIRYNPKSETIVGIKSKMPPIEISAEISAEVSNDQ